MDSPHPSGVGASQSESIIEVERIVAFFKKHAGKRKVFQETLTNHAAVTLGAKVTSTGVHSGVKVINLGGRALRDN